MQRLVSDPNRKLGMQRLKILDTIIKTDACKLDKLNKTFKISQKILGLKQISKQNEILFF